MEGWVKRRAARLKWQWHSRYLILNSTSNTLLYYNKADDLEPRKRFDIHASCKVTDPFQRDSGSEALWCLRISFTKAQANHASGVSNQEWQSEDEEDESSPPVGRNSSVQSKGSRSKGTLEVAVASYELAAAWVSAIRQCVSNVRRSIKRQKNKAEPSGSLQDMTSSSEMINSSHTNPIMTPDTEGSCTPHIIREPDYGDIPVAFRHIMDKRSIESPLTSSNVVVDRIDNGLAIYREDTQDEEKIFEWEVLRPYNQNLYLSLFLFAMTIVLLFGVPTHSSMVKLLILFLGFGGALYAVLRNVQRMKGLKPVFLAGHHVRGAPHEVNETLLATDHTRLLWDGANAQVTVLERRDEHVDVVHIRQRAVFSWPFWYKPRDMVCLRYWAREADGSYVIVMQSTSHADAPVTSNFVRAEVLFWSYLICPLKPEYLEKGSKMMMTSFVVETIRLDPRGMVAHLHPFHHFSYPFVAPLLTDLMALAGYLRSKDFVDAVSRSRVAATPSVSAAPTSSNTGYTQLDRAVEIEALANGVDLDVDDSTPSVSDLSLDDGTERASGLRQRRSKKNRSAFPTLNKPMQLPTTPTEAKAASQLWWVESDLVKGVPRERCTFSSASVMEPDATKYSIRGPTYLEDGIKIPAAPAMFRLVAVDIYSFDDPNDCRNIGSRSTICREAEAITDPIEREKHFTFVAVIIPSARNLSVVMHYQPLDPDWRTKHPRFNELFTNFMNGSDQYRNERFKLIPDIVKGPFVLRASLRTRPAIPGTKKVDIGYYGGSNWFEVDIDVSGQNKAKYLTSLALPVAKSLIVDLAFLVESQHVAELPEQIIGVVRFDKTDLSQAIKVPRGVTTLPPQDAPTAP